MSNLSVRARQYLGVSFLLAALISAGQIVHLATHYNLVNWWTVAIASVCAAFFNLFRVYGSNETDNYDLAWIIYGGALLLLDSSATMLVIWIAHLAVFLSRKHRWPWYVHAFNMASFTIVSALTAWVWHSVLGLLGNSASVHMLSICAAIGTFTVTNHVHVAGVMWVVDGQDPRRSSLFTRTSLLMDATMLAVGMLSALVTYVNPLAIMLGAAPTYLIYKALRTPMLEKQAKTDGKTGLFHGRHFKLAAAPELARANRLNRPLTLVMADLDLLRDINNTYGHLAGDLAIKTVADVLIQFTRVDDIAARFGGEEFVLLMVELSLDEALQRVEQLRQMVESAVPALPTGEKLKITMSFGVAQRNEGDTEVDVLVQRADQALYLAKGAGRNCIGVHQQPIAVLAPQCRITMGIDRLAATAIKSS